jgi:hypothetical protein
VTGPDGAASVSRLPGCIPNRAAVAEEDELRRTGHLGALVEVVVDPRLLGVGGDRDAPLRVEDDDVGVGADGERALPRIEAEQLRGIRRQELDHAVERDPSRSRAELVDHLQSVLEAGPAVRDLREVVLAECLLAVPEECAVVCGDRRQRVGANRVPENVLVLLRPWRRGVHVLGAFEVRSLEEAVVDEEVLRARLAPHIPALLARELDRLDGLLAGDVYDVERSAGDARELDRPVRRLALRLRRARQRVPVRLGVPFGQRLLHEHVDRVAVLRVHHDERPGFRRDLHRLEERLVVDHERALVRHEQFVGRDALLGQRRELLERPALAEVGDGHVVAHVDHLLAVRLAAPLVDRVGKRRARRLDDEVDVARRAAECCRRLARLDVVDRRRPAERHVEMRVRVDAAGKHVLPGCIDHSLGLDIDRFADQRDPLAFDVDVADVVVRRGDDAAALDQYGHLQISSSGPISTFRPR